MSNSDYRKCPFNNFEKCNSDCMLFWKEDEGTIDRCSFAKIANNLEETSNILKRIREEIG